MDNIRKRYQDVKKWRAMMKRRLVACFGGACAICELRENPIIYDFHHINPKEKDSGLSRQIRSWDRTVPEAKKCVMLCSHCHRKLHAGIVRLPINPPKFNEEVLAGTDMEIERGPYYDECPVCGDEKPIKQTTCSNSCAGSLRSTGKKPKNMQELLEEINSNGFMPVARRIGVSDNTLRKWLRKEKIEVPRFPNGPRPKDHH